ncbi:arginase family protein [Gallaecimonas mangrovi]|uniref:arginase family protein n=1 Tax=Gallaecimonas mangrovi TaxID=2291597 RepID=UPI000E20C4E3|nr:arginase family protein [Gallaecimonas mangrovi]
MSQTLRLVFPQWQGGNNELYHLGAQLLAWLAPEHDGPTEEVPVPKPDGVALACEEGLIARHQLLAQAANARALIDKHNPQSIVVLGGDCLVDLAPFAYLNERYQDDLAVLWVDAHPDIMTPQQFEHAHAMVLGNLLGKGDSAFSGQVKAPINADKVCYVGVNEPTDWEQQRMLQLGLKNIGPEQLREQGSQAVVEWFKATGAKHLAIHLDLDVLDPGQFQSLLFSKPQAGDEFDGIAQGQLTIADVVNVLTAVAKEGEVVGLGITEHLPWSAMALKNMLEKLPLLKKL